MLRLLSRLIIFAMAVLLVVCVWQVYQLRSEVARLNERVMALSRGQGPEASKASSTRLDEAMERVDNARRLLLRGRPERARDELSKSLQLLRRVTEDVSAGPRNTLTDMQRKADSIRNSVESIWKQLEAKPGAAAERG